MIITIQGELHDLYAQSPCMEVTRVGEAPTGKRLKTIRGGWTGNYMSSRARFNWIDDQYRYSHLGLREILSTWRRIRGWF